MKIGFIAIAAAGLALLGGPAAGQERVRSADYDWVVREIGGRELRLEKFRGEVLFINVWASWCQPCVAELSSIERLRSALGDADGIRFLMISPERERSVRRFLERNPYELPFYTEAQRMPPAYGLRALPTTFVIDRRGRIVLVHRGAANWNTAPIRALLTGLASRPLTAAPEFR